MPTPKRYVTDDDPRLKEATATHMGLTPAGFVPGNNPSTDQKAALAGTSGTPSASNKYVTNADARNTNARTPTFLSIQVFRGSTSVTFNVNSTSYIGVIPFEFNIDMDVFPFTHFRLLVSGVASEGGQSVKAQVTVAGAPSTPIHTGGDDITVTTGNLYDSGWRTRDTSNSGKVLFDVALKGSNGTVDLGATYVEVLLKVA